jgi:hypothetical protein
MAIFICNFYSTRPRSQCHNFYVLILFTLFVSKPFENLVKKCLNHSPACRKVCKITLKIDSFIA